MRNSLLIVCPSMGGHGEAVTTWEDTRSKPWPIVIDAVTTGEKAGFLTKCDEAWQQNKERSGAINDATVIGYLHSDLFILEHGWDERVLAEFDDPAVAVVGFVGARRLGTDDLGKVPYDLRQLARGEVISNLSDWEVHGENERGSCAVGVVDSCAVFVRRAFLERLGGWPVARYPNNAHCSDLWVCCAAHRDGFSVNMVGVACTHRSGGKGEVGSKWLEEHGGDSAHHRAAHRLLYEEFAGILPIRVA